MSSITRHLHRAYSTTTIRSLSQDLYKERSLKRLVEKFKNYSDIDRFRAKTGIYENTIHRLANAKCYRYIEEILEHQKKYRPDISREGFHIRLISLYGKSGMFVHAQQVFDEMTDQNIDRSIKTVNALLSACVSSSEFDKMEGLFGELQTKLGVKPDTVSYNVVINGYCKMGEVDKAVRMIDKMEKDGLGPDLVTFNTVLGGLYSSKRFLEGEKMWRRMEEKGVIPDIRSWNSRVVGFVKEKRFDEAVKIVGELGERGLKPDALSYRALIRGWCDEGNLEEAKKSYGELVRSGFYPDRVLYEMVVPLACKKGDLEWAHELCKGIFNTKCIVDVQILQGLVDGLVKESRIQEAKKVAEMGNTNNYRCYKLTLPSEELN